MRQLKRLMLITALLLGTLLFTAAPAGAVVCIEENPGGCCEDVTVAGKTILHIDCQN